MRPQDTKNREAIDVPLGGDLVDDLRRWTIAKRNASKTIGMEQVNSDGKERLFNVPKQLVKCLDRDLAAAGIAKFDERGRSVDVHALRHTIGTLLSTGGVSPRTAQQAMRHSDIRLTMNTYTDPRLLDVAGAVDALPLLALDDLSAIRSSNVIRATGTETGDRFVAPAVAPAGVVFGQKPSIADQNGGVPPKGQKTKKPLNS